MVDFIPSKVKKLWNSWDLRVAILASLSLQAFLILFSTSRKRTKSIWVLMFVWCAYLLADWVAVITLGLISTNQGDASGVEDNGDLLAIWAPFLLLHLGGPDTITSFSMEDNELWLRHLFGFIAQIVGAIYVFILSLPTNRLWIPTILTFAAGIIKYAERTRALYLASLDNFGESAFRRPNPGPEYVRIERMYSSLKRANLPTSMETVEGLGEAFQYIKYRNEEALDRLEPQSLLFRYANDFFETFKGLVVGLLLSSQDGQVSRDFFLNRTAKDALTIAEVELSLLYEVLHTKAMVVHSRKGYIFRFISFLSTVGAFLLFSLVEKQGFRRFDVLLTYTLFAGALVLDIVSLAKLLLLDTTVVILENWWAKLLVEKWWGKRLASYTFSKRRWSNSVMQLNMISYCLKDPPRRFYKIAKHIGCGNLFDQLWIARMLEDIPLTEDLRHFIFMELRMKTLKAKNMKEAMAIGSKRGGWVLQQSSFRSNSLTWSVEKVEYAESLLLWHIATELCYHKGTPNEVPNYKMFSKHLSDYAYYLLLRQPTMMAPVLGNWRMIFEDTRAEAKRYFHNKSNREHSAVCGEILKEPMSINPADVRGDSKSIFFNACMLAKQLLEINENRWELISKVWVELLCYAAINCRGNVHAQQPSKGGELLTLIWLLMNHFCLANQFYESNTARTKLILMK